MSLSVATTREAIEAHFEGFGKITGVSIADLSFDWGQFCKMVMYVLWDVTGQTEATTTPTPISNLLTTLFRFYKPDSCRNWRTRTAPEFPTHTIIGGKLALTLKTVEGRDVEVACFVQPTGPTLVRLGEHNIPLEDFCAMACHFLTGGVFGWGDFPTPDTIDLLLSDLLAVFSPIAWIKN